MSRKAIIDIGSNSIKFFVGELAADRTIKTVLDTNDIARLGEGLDSTGAISPEAMERNVASVAAFAKQAKELGADQIVSVGTMALRKASNSAEFVEKVKKTCGVEVQIIPGEEEARLSYLAILSGLPLEEDADLVVFDTGGGSTEFIYGKGTQMVKRFSVNLGAVRITENYLKADPVSPADVQAAIAQIDKEFKEAGVNGKPAQLVGMGGTVTSMGAVKHKMVKYDPSVIQGSRLTKKDIEEQIEEYSKRTVEQRKELPGLQPKRADVILAGACILKVITDRLGADGLTISDRGLRHGLAFDLFQK
ncbi:Ppx/GppA family phosphatase [Treponema parvum]|uniref:Ppx/GppA family phosphatase n=1 Tax=Treponema parvum TaxID=138851 RepID=A0A975F017_9SPIR|nr:Ppx/GppA phosphatase family protein [Treponema parvum]QTQ12056.1 Ppx/GppA family phosphatase [Treponema parvum]QTQ15968.1 Ppx/GppA family phosphatase [Treponema parvum]